MEQDEDAFAVLVCRHGRPILGVCRRVLRDPNDADDVFQATFLLLARKAGSLLRPGSVGAWLHAVAYRLALRARAEAGRRHARETGAPLRTATPPDEPAWELRAALDEELSRLPEVYRAVVVLCCVEGKSRTDAAEQLGCKPGAVKIRLERARERLRDRLTRRGFAVSHETVASLLGGGAALALVPAALAETTAQAAVLLAAGAGTAGVLSPTVLSLAGGGFTTMALTKSKILAVVVLALVLGGGGTVLYRAAAGEEGKSAPGSVPGQVAEGKAEETAPSVPRARPAEVEEVIKAETKSAWARVLNRIAVAEFKAKLQKERLAEELSDPEFLRRIYLDVLGVLPQPEEVKAFLDDPRTEKRELMIDELLERPELSAVWALKWARLTNRAQLSVLARVLTEGEAARALALSPDSKLLAVGGEKVRVLDAATGKIVFELARLAPGEAVNVLGFSPDGKRLVVGGARIGGYDLATGKLLFQLDPPAPGEAVKALAFSPDGQLLAAAGARIRVYQAATGKIVSESTPGAPILRLSFSADGKTLEAVLRQDHSASMGGAPLSPVRNQAGRPVDSLKPLLQANDPEVRRLTAELLARLERLASEDKGRDEAAKANLEKKLDRLIQELEQARRELRDQR